MKTENQQSTQASTSAMTNTFLSVDTKYGGLIKQTLNKRVRNSLFILVAYIDTTSPHFQAMHSVIAYFRFFQLLGPALFAASIRFWPFGELHQKIVSYVSVLFHIVPVEYRYEASIYIEIIYIIVIIFYFILMISSSFVYKNSSKLPRAVLILISILDGTVMYLIHPVALQMSSEDLSRIIMGIDTYADKTFSIVCIVLTYICAIVYFYAFAKIMSITLLFRPTSMLTTSNVPQLFLLAGTDIITILSALTSFLSKIPYAIVTILTAIIYFLLSLIVFLPGSFIKSRNMKLIFASGVTGGIVSLIVCVFGIIDHKASLAVLFIIIAIFVVVMIVSFPIIDFYEKKCLKKLDEFADDSNLHLHFKTPNILIRDACIGYKYAHPVCLDWSLFKAGSEEWSESSTIWATFGKFVAIYPEENSLLSYIIHNIQSKKLKGNFAKQTIAQGRMIMTQRETSLTQPLKKKLQHVGKSVQKSKRKLRQIWDIVIQNNIHEIEPAINNAYDTINKAQSEFNHVLSEYPNNRFIARSYAKFLQEVKADSKGFNEWIEKIKLLQKGISATVDKTNGLGIDAFPNLPHILLMKNDGGVIQGGETESSFALDVEIDEDKVNDQMSGIRDQINSIKIPALNLVSIISVLTFIILIVVPVIVVFLVAKTYINSLNKPLEFMYYLSYLRTLANQLPAFSFRSIFEKYPSADNPAFNMPDYSDIEISSLDYRTDTKDQYTFLIKELTTSVEAVGKFRSYGVEEPILEPVCEKTFRSTLNYTFYDVNGNSTGINVSIQSALMDYTIQLSKLSSLKTYDESDFKSPIVMNPLVNTEMINNATSYSIDIIIEYLKSIETDMDKLMLIVLIACVAFFLVYYIVITVIEVKKVQYNKHEIYSCLTSLPKNVVSGVAESLRILKKDTEGTRTTEKDTEYSKQEDNILKLFAAAGDDEESISEDWHIFIICNIAFLVCDVLIAFFFTQMFKDVTKSLNLNGPHLNYVFGATAYMMEAMSNLDIAGISFRNDFNYSMESIELLKTVKTSLNYFTYYYQRARYGGPSANEQPFPQFVEVNEEAELLFSCPNEDAVPKSYRDTYRCFSPDQQTALYVGLAEKLSLPVIQGNVSILNTTDSLYDDLWYISAILLYESFFHPMFVSIMPRLEDTLESAIPDTLTKIIIFVIIALLFVVIINIVVLSDYKKLKFCLSLLLHCQASIIMQTQKIIDILNGHFTHKGKDSTTRNERFFTEVVSKLPDSIIVINNQMIITAANKSTERIYSVDSESLIGTNEKTFLSSPNFSENMTPVVANAATIAAAISPTNVQYSKDANTTNYLELSCVTFNQFYVMTTQDVTRMFVYNTLIQEEKAKSDKLLASILPPSMVVRVQKGEKNISFAVQSATILFLDIVSFTPWCASNTAAMVMQTLNNMFKLLDNKLATHQTATKIKCIGDCYMCAGGIFSEVNQPNVHAKEIVEFGQESIECIRQLDEEYQLSLQIRVGINTGGPIVAGVLGTEKPTFEILGPAINMAQQMEHHGVPMQVHISRSVYELVYGGSFVIKERGQIEIKSGKVITYLVQDKNSQS